MWSRLYAFPKYCTSRFKGNYAHDQYHSVQYILKYNKICLHFQPSNIFISTSGQLQIQLGDFGLACPQIGTHHSVVGTRMYAAPEQLQGKCDPKVIKREEKKSDKYINI